MLVLYIASLSIVNLAVSVTVHFTADDNLWQVPTDEEKAEEKEETGWKLIHADVFRPPTEYPMLFCVLVGTGMQLIVSALFLIIFSAVGFLSPANRGSIMIGMLLIFVLLGAAAGFTSARLYKTFKVRFLTLFAGASYNSSYNAYSCFRGRNGRSVRCGPRSCSRVSCFWYFSCWMCSCGATVLRARSPS